MKTLLSAGLSAVMLSAALVPVVQTINVSDALAAQPSTRAAKALLASGQFVGVDQSHPTSGTARIVEKDGQRFLELGSDFDTVNGPAVQIVLHKGNSVPASLTEGSYVYIADLQSFDGAQRYLIPADVDITAYESVAIWCEEFNVTFGFADI